MQRQNRCGRILELFYAILFQPRKGMRKIALLQPVRLGLGCFLLVELITLLASCSAAVTAGLPNQIDNLWPGMIICGLIFSLIMLFLMVAIISFAAELLGGKGTGKQTLAVLSFAALPNMLIAPFTVISKLIGFDLSLIVALAIGVWTFVIEVIGIRIINRFSTGNAVLAVLTPLFIMLAVICIFLIILITIGIQAIEEFA